MKESGLVLNRREWAALVAGVFAAPRIVEEGADQQDRLPAVGDSFESWYRLPALPELLVARYRVVSVIHDEIVVEVESMRFRSELDDES